MLTDNMNEVTPNACKLFGYDMYEVMPHAYKLFRCEVNKATEYTSKKQRDITLMVTSTKK